MDVNLYLYRQDNPVIYTRINYSKPARPPETAWRDNFAGRTHVDDFAMFFCSTPGCSNFFETEESINLNTTFKCRGCIPANAVGAKIQPWQFDKYLGGHAPEGAGHSTNKAYDHHTSKKHAKRELRRFLDNNDPMMSGHQIKKDRKVERDCPDWMLNDFEVRSFLYTSFPRMFDLASRQCNAQRDKAALWYAVIHLYHRMGLPASYTASLMSVQKVIRCDAQTPGQRGASAR